MKRVPKSVRLSIVVVSTAALLGSGVPGVLGETVVDQYTQTQASEQVDGPTFAHGVFRDAKGHGVGGRVVALAWPRSDILGALKDGDSLQRLPIGKAVLAPDGSFRLKVDPKVDVTGYQEVDGTINVTLEATSPNGRGYRAISRRLDKDKSWKTGGPDAQDPETTPVDFKVMNEAAPSAPAPGETTAPALSKLLCDDTVVTTYNDKVVYIGETYTGPHAKADFNYTTGASSKLGIGISVSGKYASYDGDGEATYSSDSGINFAQRSYNTLRMYSTTWQYKKFLTYQWTALGCIGDHYEVRPTAYQGASGGYTPCCAPTATYCSTVTDDTWPVEHWKETAAAVKWSDGVKIGGDIGINLSSQTGYNTKTKIQWLFYSTGKLCGNNSNGWPSSSRVVGK